MIEQTDGKRLGEKQTSFPTREKEENKSANSWFLARLSRDRRKIQVLTDFS